MLNTFRIIMSKSDRINVNKRLQWFLPRIFRKQNLDCLKNIGRSFHKTAVQPSFQKDKTIELRSNNSLTNCCMNVWNCQWIFQRIATNEPLFVSRIYDSNRIHLSPQNNLIAICWRWFQQETLDTFCFELRCFSWFYFSTLLQDLLIDFPR